MDPLFFYSWGNGTSLEYKNLMFRFKSRESSLILPASPSRINSSRHWFSCRWLCIWVLIISSKLCLIWVTLSSDFLGWIKISIELIYPSKFFFSSLSAIKSRVLALNISERPENPTSSFRASISSKSFSLRDTLIMAMALILIK